jgi:hypothetical protein
LTNDGRFACFYRCAGLADDETLTEIAVLDVELSALEIHENYRVDIAHGTLVRKA